MTKYLEVPKLSSYIRHVNHKITHKMEIPVKLIKKWKMLRSHGDAAEMAKLSVGYSDESFNRAFREGKCSDEVFKVMAEFYEQRAALIKEYL